MEAAPQLHVHILIEGAGEPITGGGQYAPPATGGRRVAHGAFVSGVTETEERQRLQRAVEYDRA